MLRDHPLLAYALCALLALSAVVALLGAYGVVAAVLGALAWLALPERDMRLRAVRGPASRSLRR
jgi:membrane associated rhomboid family serine protease